MFGTVYEKIKISAYFGLLLGMIAGLIRSLVFVINDMYPVEELQRYGLYLFQHQIQTYVLWGIVIGIIFAIVWIFINWAERIAVAGFMVLVPIVPLGYFINKNFLPGRTEIGSIIGNAVLLLMAVVVTFIVFRFLSKEGKFLRRFYSPIVFTFFIIAFAGLNVFYHLTPRYKRLENSPQTFGRGFLDLFDFSSTAQQGDSPPNQEVLLSHFEKRTEKIRQDIHEFLANHDRQPSDVISEADSILGGQFTMWDRGGTVKMTEKIDWYHNPKHDKVWLFALNEFEWFRPVMIAYVLTNDEKYAKAYAHLMTSFLDQVSMPQWKNEKDPVWRLIGAGLRMCESWADAFYVFLPSKAVSADLKIRILSSIHDHALFLSHFRSPHWNHLIQETYGLLRVAAMFPEFKMANDWVKVGVERLDRALSKDVYPDGGYNEGSTFYHRYVVRLLQFIVDFAEDWDIELTDNIHHRLEMMYEFLLYTSRPDGTMPEMNDGFHTWKLRHLLRDPAIKFARDDFQYFSTNGTNGQKPVRVSTEFPYSGIYVMRSDWTEDAKYCILDGGLFGSAHGHEDKLSFEIHAFGSPFIIEAGTYTYVNNNWHRYFESSFSHNTIIVDGRGQLRQPDKGHWFTDPHARMANKWVSTDEFDYFESTYDGGYGHKKERMSHDVTHTRRVLFIKPDYWLLWDVLTGKGEHKFEQLFHFVPIPMEILEDRKAILTQKKRGGNLLLQPLYIDDLSVQKIVGSENPIQGWVSLKYGEKMPSPAIIFTRTQNTPASFLQLLLPFQNDFKIESVSLSEIPVRLEGLKLDETTSVGIMVSSEDWTDYVMLAPNTKGTKKFDQFESGKELFYFRENRDGEIEREFDVFLNDQKNRKAEGATLVNSRP